MLTVTFSMVCNIGVYLKEPVSMSATVYTKRDVVQSESPAIRTFQQRRLHRACVGKDGMEMDGDAAALNVRPGPVSFLLNSGDGHT